MGRTVKKEKKKRDKEQQRESGIRQKKEQGIMWLDGSDEEQEGQEVSVGGKGEKV